MRDDEDEEVEAGREMDEGLGRLSRELGEGLKWEHFGQMYSVEEGGIDRDSEASVRGRENDADGRVCERERERQTKTHASHSTVSLLPARSKRSTSHTPTQTC